MSNVTNTQNITDDSVTIAVQSCRSCSQEISNQLTLNSTTTSGIETNIVGIGIPVHGIHINGTRNRVRRLTVEEYQGLVLVQNNSLSVLCTTGKNSSTDTGQSQSTSYNSFHIFPPRKDSIKKLVPYEKIKRQYSLVRSHSI